MSGNSRCRAAAGRSRSKSTGTSVLPWCSSWKYACWPLVPAVPHTISPVGTDTARRSRRPTCRCSPSPAAGGTTATCRARARTGTTACVWASRKSRYQQRRADPCSTGTFSGHGAVRKCSSISCAPASSRRSARDRSRPSTTARSPTTSSTGHRPSPRTRTCCGVDAELDDRSAFVDTATKCFATASSPSASTSQVRAECAFVSVSSVVNVFDETTNSVSAGSSRAASDARSAPSTFDTNRHATPARCTRAARRSAIAGPRSLPPIPMFTTVRIAARVPGPLPDHLLGERAHAVEHTVHLGDDVDAVDDQRRRRVACAARRAGPAGPR